MPFFRRKSEKTKIMSSSVYGQKCKPTPPCSRSNSSDDGGSLHFADDRTQPFLAFAEVTFDPSLPMQTKSRLSKSLNDVLHDSEALSYFIQFIDARHAKHLVKFWLDAESFRMSVLARLQCAPIGSEGPQVSTATFRPPLTSSDSSGCISQQSDDSLLQSSSQNCDPQMVRPKTNHLTNSCLTVRNSISNNERLSSGDTSPSQIHTLNSKAIFSVEETQVLPKKSLSDPIVNKMNNGSVSSSLVTSSVQRNHSESSSGLIRLQTSIEQDAKAIYEHYIASNAPQPINVSDELRNQIVGNIFKCDGNIDPACFSLAQQHVVNTMDREYFSSFLRSSYHCKHQVDVLTSGTVYLADVLYNDSALFYFMEFMEQENVRHLVDFLLMADNFQKHLLLQGSYDGNQAQSDAMIIYEKYFSLQATNSLGFSNSIRYEVEHNICREEGPLPDCYLKPVKILTQYIEKTFLLQFLNSERYFKYISECVITIQNEGANLDMLSKTSGSESGSEHSLPITSVNTLLAMPDKPSANSSKVLKNISDQVMRIDTGLFKPDSLWQRQFAGKLQLVHMDNLGRIVTEFEPEPDRRRESRLSKAVKKLVNREDDKVQEEMAWQVAEMIVNDICCVTMPDLNSNKTEDETAS